MKKDAVITVRLPRPLRRRIEALARAEARSLSQQVERLIERGLGADGLPRGGAKSVGASALRPLAGLLAGGRVATVRDFREVRTLLSKSFRRRTITVDPADR